MEKKHTISPWYSIPLLGVLFFHLACESMVIPILAPTLATPVSAAHDMLPGFSAEIHKLCYGISLAVYPVAVFFCAPILGALSDKIGRKPVLIYALAGTIAGSLLQGVGMEILSVCMFLLGRALVGATAGIDGAIQAALLDRCSTEKQKNFYLGATLLAMSVGFIAGPAFAALFINESSSQLAWSMPFFATAAAFVLMVAVLAKSMPGKMRKIRGELARFNWLAGLGDILTLRRSEKIRRLLLIFILSEVASGCFTALIPLVLAQSFEFGVKDIAWFMSLQGACGGIVFAWIGPAMISKISKTAALKFSLFMATAGCAIPLFESLGEWIWSVAAIQALGFMLSYYVVLAILSESCEEEKRGWILSVMSSLWGLTVGIGLVACGVLVAVSNTFCLAACAALCAASLALCDWNTHAHKA